MDKMKGYQNFSMLYWYCNCQQS